MDAVLVRVLRPQPFPHDVARPNDIVRLSATEAEARRLQGLVEPIETATNERRETAALRPARR